MECNRAPFLGYFKFCAIFRSHQLNQTRVTVHKHQIWFIIVIFIVPYDLEMLRMTFKNDMAYILCYFKLYSSFRSHRWIQTVVIVRKRQFGSKSAICRPLCTLNYTNDLRTPLCATSSYVPHFAAIRGFKLDLWSEKSKIGTKFALISVTLTFDLWPWPFAWTWHLWMEITPENVRMIRWQKHCEKGVTEGRTDRRTKAFLELLCCS